MRESSSPPPFKPVKKEAYPPKRLSPGKMITAASFMLMGSY
jgi:hypothetical protein